MAGYTDDIDLALRSAPEARKDPTLAIAAASMGGNVQQNAEVTAHAINTQAIGNAVQKAGDRHGGKGALGATLGWLGGGIKGAMDMAGDTVGAIGSIANKPLEQVQRQYRFMRDVEARHGFGAMLGMAVPMVLGGAAGGVVGGGYGAALGVEGVGWLMDAFNLGYKDSWERVASDDYVDPHGGSAVSPGRDAARFLGSLSKHIGVNIEQHKGFDLYDAVSGLGDGLFSITADPLSAAGAMRKQALTVGAKGLLATKWGGTAIKSTDLAIATAQYPQVKRGLESLAKMDAETIVARHKKLAPFAKELGAADTWEKVGQVLKDNADAAQMKLRYLPRQGLANVPFATLVNQIHQKAGDLSLAGVSFDEAGKVIPGEPQGKLGGLGTAVARRAGESYKRVTTFVPTSFNEATQELSRTTLFLNDAGSARSIYEMARWGRTDEMARKVAGMWSTGTIDDRMTIFRNVMSDNMANRMEAIQPGWTTTPDGSQALARIGDQIDMAFGGIDAGKTTAWGYDAEGRILSKMPSQSQTISAPILEYQHYNVPMPDYLTFDRNLKSFQGASKVYGAVDDFVYDHFTQKVFKRWALATGGFAIRAAAADLIPAFAKDPKRFTQAKIANIMVKHGWDMEKGEEEHILAGVARFLAHKSDITDDELAVLALNYRQQGSHITNAAVRAGHESGIEVVGLEEYVKDSIYSLKREVPTAFRVVDEPQAWKADHKDHYIYWHKQAKDMAEKSPATVAAAKAYREAIKEATGGIAIPLADLPPEVTQRAVAAAKQALDELPEDVLNQHKRHFYGSARDEQIPGATVASDVRRWVEGSPGKPGRYEATGEVVTYGQTTQQPTLVNPRGNTPGGMKIGSVWGGMGDDVPLSTTRPGEKWVEGVEAVPARTEQVMGPEFGPQFVEQGTLPMDDTLVGQGYSDVTTVDPHLDWARVIVENLKGTVAGADGKLHDDLLAAIGEGRAIDPKILQGVPLESRPNKIMGAYEKPPAPERLHDKIFSKLNTFINWAAREPVYNQALLKEWENFKPLVEAGTLTMDDALTRMNTRAVQAVLPHIDNAAERSLHG